MDGFIKRRWICLAYFLWILALEVGDIDCGLEGYDILSISCIDIIFKGWWIFVSPLDGGVIGDGEGPIVGCWM